MDVPIPKHHSNCFCFKELYSPFSLRKCCFFLLIFLLIVLIIVGLGTFFVFLIMKPHKPIFSVRSIKMDFYNVDDRSNQTLLVSSVVSLTLNAENHNKFGIGYSPSRFLVYHENLPVGIIRIPQFFQPPHSHNVSVTSRVLLQSVNVSKIVAKAQDHQESNGKMAAKLKILGDAKTHLWVHHVKLLGIKVGLDCNMDVDLRELSNFTDEVYSDKVIHLASVLSNWRGISMNCASTLYI